MSAPQVIDVRRNIHADFDGPGGKVMPICEIVLVVASPAYRTDAAGRTVQEYTTSDVRFAVGVEGLQGVIDTLTLYLAEIKAFADSVKLDADKFRRAYEASAVELEQKIDDRGFERQAAGRVRRNKVGRPPEPQGPEPTKAAEPEESR